MAKLKKTVEEVPEPVVEPAVSETSKAVMKPSLRRQYDVVDVDESGRPKAITSENRNKLGALVRIKVTEAELAALQKDKLLVGYDPNTQEAIIRGG
jgi:hypothetical protein